MVRMPDETRLRRERRSPGRRTRPQASPLAFSYALYALYSLCSGNKNGGEWRTLRVRPAAWRPPLLAQACLFCVAMIFFAAGCARENISASTPANITVSGPVIAGRLENPKIIEASGLAPSRRGEGILWVHNDSGNDPAIYAISTEGKHLGAVWPAGADNIDWEDIESFVLGGRAYILIADFGDNNARRKNCSFYVIEEPDRAQLSPGKDLIVPVAWQVPVAFPDGPHDCEAVAVDPGAAPDGSGGRVYILLKRDYPFRLFTVPLKPAALAPDGVIPAQIAWQVGKLTEIPRPNAVQNLLPIPTGQYRGDPTGMSFSPGGRFAVVLTYGDVLLYPRREGESWLAALLRKPVILPPHKLGQAEGVCFSRDGKSIFVTEEAAHARLLRYDLRYDLK